MKFKSLLDNTVQDIETLNKLIKAYASDYKVLTSKGSAYWTKLSDSYPTLFRDCVIIADFIAVYEDASKPLMQRAEKDIKQLTKKLILTNMQAKNANRRIVKALR